VNLIVRTLVLLVALGTVLLTGCTEPKVRGTLLRQPSSRIERLIIDTSMAYSPNSPATNLWATVMRGGFGESAPQVFATYGVQAILANLDGEARTLVHSPRDYILVVSFKSGFYGSTGNGAFFTLNLNDAFGHIVWTGNTFVSGSGNILTKNLGEVVANNIAKALALNELIAVSGSIDATSASAASAPGLPAKLSPRSPLTAQQQSAFDNFKSMDQPKAFVIGDGGVFFTASGKSPAEPPPGLRALKACEDSKSTNCRVFSDGFRVLDPGLPASQLSEQHSKEAETVAETPAHIGRPILSGKLQDAWKDFQGKPYNRVFVLDQNEHWNAVWGRKTGLSAAVDEALDSCKRQDRVNCRVYAVNGDIVWSRTDVRGGY
jgi:hypothetical protein